MGDIADTKSLEGRTLGPFYPGGFIISTGAGEQSPARLPRRKGGSEPSGLQGSRCVTIRTCRSSSKPRFPLDGLED